MSKTVKKIILVLTLIILLPGLFFTVYETNQIKESEEVLEDIYASQLNAILFSVNLYSGDIVAGWRNSLNTILLDGINHPANVKQRVDSLFSLNKSLTYIIFADSAGSNKISVYSSPENYHYQPTIENFREFFLGLTPKINRLVRYRSGGYNKIEPVDNAPSDSSASILFLLNDPQRSKNICIIMFSPQKFVNNVLGQKIAEITTDNELIITCTEVESNNLILSTGVFRYQDILQKKSLWIIPGYELGILPQGQTIETILIQRRNNSILLIFVLTAILIVGVVVIFRSIRHEVELAQIKSDFVSNVSHELRTPLALISMFAETLEMGRARTEAKKQEYYTIISKEANRLSRIVNKILSFSKIEAGKRDYHISKANLNKIVEDVFGNYQFHLQNNGFKFILQKDDELPNVNADSEAVSEAVINLVDNAVKYSNDQKEILIITGVDKNFAFIEVKDKGVGIPAELQTKIFDKFYRVSEGLVHNTKGTGLGLTLVKHIMEAHKGDIKVKSKPGEGSSFILLFPLSTNS
jgi:two-component system, OmpR family, phosphate regulon sensor histidine kinase PhoR